MDFALCFQQKPDFLRIKQEFCDINAKDSKALIDYFDQFVVILISPFQAF